MSDVDNSTTLSEAVSKRIRALLSKTTANGATEAEAILAAEKARELMDKYRLSMTDVEIQAEPVITEDVKRRVDRKVNAVDYCLGGIKAYCGVKAWYHTDYYAEGGHFTKQRRVRFMGLKSDLEMARYLYEMLGATIKAEATRYQRTPDWQASTQHRIATSAFKVGMASRINDRLIEMARAADPVAKTATGTALVVVKNALVEDAYAKLGLKLRSVTTGMSTRNGAAYFSGRAAGDRVNLSRPVTSTSNKRIA